MICYRGMTFCSDADTCPVKIGCDRFFSETERERSVKWWGKEGAPVAFMSFAKTCKRLNESVAP